MRPLPLRHRLTLAFAGCASVVLALVGAAGIAVQWVQLGDRLERDTIRRADRLMAALQHPVWTMDETQVQLLLQAEIDADRQLRWVAVEFAPGRVIGMQRGPGDAASAPIHALPAWDRSVERRDIHPPGQPRSAPVGVAMVAPGYDALRAELGQRACEILLQILIVDLALAVVAWFVVNRIFARRVAPLAAVVQGAPETQAIAPGGDELQQLSEGARALVDRLAAVLTSIGDAVVTVDARMQVERANPAARALFGVDIPRRFDDLLAILPDGGVLATEIAGRTIQGGTPFTVQEPLRLAGGVRLAVAAHPLPAPAGGAVIVLRDVTRELLARERLHQAEKLESVGRLAGSLAHDINNVLTAIMGAAELLPRAVTSDDRDRLIKTILDASGNAAEFTKRLLSFARRDGFRHESLDLREVVDQASGILRHSLGRQVSIRIGLCDEPVPTLGDRAALVNCLINLGINARDAMPQGGNLILDARRQRLHDGESLIVGELPPGEYACLSAVDGGTGIPDEVRQRLFEPFFTTKPAGQGTGLGLAAVYNAVRAHGGAIAVDSRPGRTEFRLLLPLELVPQAEPTPIPAPPMDMGYGEVLVVDDDDTVRLLGCALLRAVGFIPIPAEDAAHALDQHQPGRFRFAIIDLLMPDMDGRQLALILREREATLPILFATGYGGDADLDGLAATPHTAVLGKPYRFEELQHAIRMLLTV